MKLYIKNMVCIRCKLVVRSELETLGISYGCVELGQVNVNETIPSDKLEALRAAVNRQLKVD